MDWTTTTTLLEGLCTSDRDPAWGHLSRRLRPPIVSLAKSMGLPGADAEDVAQETLVVFSLLYREGSFDRSKGRLSHWLFGIAHRQTLNARRKRARRDLLIAPGMDTTFWSAVADPVSPNARWEQEWNRSILQECLERARREATPATYGAFELVVLQQRTTAEAATALGTTVKAVYNAKHRILKRIRLLREEFEDGVLGEVPRAVP